MHKVNAKAQQLSAKPVGSADRCRVLIADDDLEMRKMLAWSLAEKGFQVTECGDGNCLMKRLGFLGPSEEVSAFDLVISDMKMPGVTGMQVLESARVYEDFPPMILITAFGDEDIHAKAKKLGAAAVLYKPFEMDDLITKIVQILPFCSRSVQHERFSGEEELLSARFPVEITFRHGCETDPARDLVLDLAGKLNDSGSNIKHLQVVVDQSNPGEHRKHKYLVTLTATVPGKPLIAKYDSDKDNGYGNLYLAIQAAFGTLYQQVKKYQSKRINHKSGSTLRDKGVRS